VKRGWEISLRERLTIGLKKAFTKCFSFFAGQAGGGGAPPWLNFVLLLFDRGKKRKKGFFPLFFFFCTCKNLPGGAH